MIRKNIVKEFQSNLVVKGLKLDLCFLKFSQELKRKNVICSNFTFIHFLDIYIFQC